MVRSLKFILWQRGTVLGIAGSQVLCAFLGEPPHS